MAAGIPALTGKREEKGGRERKENGGTAAGLWRRLRAGLRGGVRGQGMENEGI